LRTCLVAIEREGLSANGLEARLRALTPPIVARIEQGRVLLDLRTVLPDQDSVVSGLLQRL
jgi:L-seryl-tRNA(Ser) seleniumtransferase